MPTIFTHVAVPLAIGLGLGTRVIPQRLRTLGMVAAIVPDLDVLAFGLGIPYGDALGHRGMTHSLVFSLLLAGCGTFSARALHTTRWTAFAFLFLAVASHGLLDSFTNGGLGCALLWPFSDERFFMPWRGIEVSPIGAHFFSSRGLVVLASELMWVWLPCMALSWVVVVVRRRRANP